MEESSGGREEVLPRRQWGGGKRIRAGATQDIKHRGGQQLDTNLSSLRFTPTLEIRLNG